jgi:hypothetical protein
LLLAIVEIGLDLPTGKRGRKCNRLTTVGIKEMPILTVGSISARIRDQIYADSHLLLLSSYRNYLTLGSYFTERSIAI